MSSQLINQYYSEVDNIKQYGGTSKETSVRTAFHKLLNEYCKTKNFILVTEISIETEDGRKTPDGTVKDALRLDWGYWESKDEYDDLDVEIRKKLSKGYPSTNILFEDSITAVLIQGGREVMRVPMRDPEKLDEILTAFINYERPEVHDFRIAIEQFKDDIPKVLTTLREMINGEFKANHEFQKAFRKFTEMCRESINVEITKEDIREMLIQHILTEEIFVTIFNEAQFHRENNIARELLKVEETFFTGKTKRQVLGSLDRYYNVIKAKAASIYDHHEKQKFLKVVYENFYKAYNPKGADRLGIVYTPNEIVRFMVESADYLTHRHFGKLLADKNVEILDPAAGTGTFVTELIEYIPKDKLEYKYKSEIHCNEVAILPYYIANLNIEFNYKQKMDQYDEFRNICFVDTLDNLGFGSKSKQTEMIDFGLGVENSERIRRQNRKKISVIIGNPPYNANQKNENENNKNREYEKIDQRIKETYIELSTAQKTKVYDMYARFLRWASDRLHRNGVIAFVSNNSFVDSRTYDGFRKSVAKEFNEIYVVDLKGNARTSGERRRKEGGNVFSDEIRVGVAVYFLIRNEGAEGCKIHYNAIRDYAKAEEKKAYLVENKIQNLSFDHIVPDEHGNWINMAHNDFDSLLPLATKKTKQTKRKVEERAVFKLSSLGVVTARDEWVYDWDTTELERKIRYLVKIYNRDVDKLKGTKRSEVADEVDYSIKWTRAVKNDLVKGKKYSFQRRHILVAMYRAFVKKQIYFSKELNEMEYQLPSMFYDEKRGNTLICVNVGNKPFNALATNIIPDYHINGDAICISLYRYDHDGNRIDNITDWGLEQFNNQYPSEGKKNNITKDDIFHYVYGVLHDPAYRKKYELNLKREFPRIPFYKDFWKWADWGKKLMKLHIEYEKAKPYPLKVVTSKIPPGTKIKSKLKADREAGIIYLDDATSLEGIPSEAWEYKLGNRSALEWVLDQYKETKASDPTIAEMFDNYRFADYKKEVIELLKKVCTVSVETVKVVEQMGK
jgi:predicted helicase